MRADRLYPAIVGWVAIFAFVGLYDWWLIKRGHPPLTAVARTPGGRAVRAYVGLHFDQRLGPLDLFSRMGSTFTPNR